MLLQADAHALHVKVKAGIDASIDLLISSSELFLEEFSTVVVAEPERGAVLKSGNILRILLHKSCRKR